MTRYDNPEEPLYFGEVIGSAMSYHLPNCHIIQQIRRRNYKRLRDWQEATGLGLKPCPHCRPPSGTILVNTEADANGSDSESTERSPLTASELGDIRRALMNMLRDLEPGGRPANSEDGPASRIDRLSRARIIPRDIAACMRTITEIRNAAEYEAKSSRARSSAVEGALLVIAEWADEHGGITLPDILREGARRASYKGIDA